MSPNTKAYTHNLHTHSQDIMARHVQLTTVSGVAKQLISHGSDHSTDIAECQAALVNR